MPRKLRKKPKRLTYQLIAPEGPGAPIYTLLGELVAEHHDHLYEARIALAWNRSWKPDVDGRTKLGMCKKASDLDRELAPYDFVIVLREEFWCDHRVTDVQRRALLDHELCHAEVALDDEGDPMVDERGRKQYRIRKHDIEEFGAIAERYGCWKRDLEQFAAALRRAPRLEFGHEYTSWGIYWSGQAGVLSLGLVFGLALACCVVLGWAAKEFKGFLWLQPARVASRTLDPHAEQRFSPRSPWKEEVVIDQRAVYEDRDLVIQQLIELSLVDRDVIRSKNRSRGQWHPGVWLTSYARRIVGYGSAEWNVWDHYLLHFQRAIHCRCLTAISHFKVKDETDWNESTEMLLVRFGQQTGMHFIEQHEGALRVDHRGFRSVRAVPSGLRRFIGDVERGAAGAYLQGAYNNQPNRPRRNAVVRISNARIYLLLSLSGFTFVLQLIGAWLWARNRDRDRWYGWCLVGVGSVGFALTGLWWFGWL